MGFEADTLSGADDLPQAHPSPDIDVLRVAGRWLHLIRELEATGRRLYLQGRLPGSFYDGRGQEATAVGAALAMHPDDVACPLIRDMGVHLVRGVTPAEMLRHYLGKAGGPMEGRDGNIHLGAFDRGTIPMISHLPEMLPVGMGVAISRQRRGRSAAALGFCGDGATSGGVFHETLNLAAVWRAPLVVIVERNHYAYMTPEDRYLPVDEIRSRAAGYGIASASVDGNDVMEVFRTVREALDRARDGEGPTLLEAFTYRMHGHGAHDSQRYVPDGEIESWTARDPLTRWREQAERELGWTAEQHEELVAAVNDEVKAALTDALDAPYPAVEGLAPSVFA
jgi:pyruvate dehydrogenase E1 component alpha subunit